MTTFGAVRQLAGRAARPGRRRHDGRREERIRTQLGVGVQVLTWSLLSLAALTVWALVFALGLSGLEYQHDQHTLYTDYRAQLAAATAPIAEPIATGAPVALLQAPSAGLNGIVVVEGTAAAQLRSGPGHYPGAPLPGQAGVSVLMGRSASYGAPFAKIVDLNAGDLLAVTTGQGTFRYAVEDVRRPGDPFPPQLPAGGSQLTLVTSEGVGWQSGWAPTHAVFVDALLQGKPAPTPNGGAVVTAAQQIMHSDTSGLYPLILWLQLLIIGTTVLLYLRGRWGLWQGWLIGAPIILAALWGATTNAWLLMPNLV